MDASQLSGRLAGVNGKVKDEVKATRAIVTGRRTFELADGWGSDHYEGVPIFVLTPVSPATRQGNGR